MWSDIQFWLAKDLAEIILFAVIAIPLLLLLSVAAILDWHDPLRRKKK